MNLIGRYIFREALTSTAIVISVLLLIFMSNQFAETLGDAAADTLPREAVLRVFGLQFVQYLAILAPIGVLMGILLAMARLNRDSEMTALASAIADAASLSNTLVPAMEQRGYTKLYAGAITAASSIIGPIVPPSMRIPSSPQRVRISSLT